MLKYLKVIRTLGLRNTLIKGSIFLLRKSGIQGYFSKYYNYDESPGRGFDTMFPNWNQIGFLSDSALYNVNEWIQSLDSDQVDRLCQKGNQVINGKWQLFSKHFIRTRTPNFNLDPLDNITWPAGRHFSTYFQFDQRYGDIKRVWELNRFQFLDPLLAGYSLSHPENKKEYKKFFSDLISSWLDQNPHDKSVAWACSQEISIRCIKLVFLFRYLEMDTNKQLVRLFRNFLVHSASHVAREISYAKSQRNNHAINEACFLIIFGLLFKGNKFADKYFLLGKDTIEHCCQDQFFPDGTYIQNSFTYHRFALQSIILIYSGITDELLRGKLKSVISKSFQFLHNITFGENGDFPNYGPNDGAILYNWGSNDYRDMRPLLNQLSIISTGKVIYNIPTLLLDTIITTEFNAWGEYDTIPSGKHSYDSSGYYILKNRRYDVLFRCGSYSGRYPSQNDMLHTDVWYDGKPILIDSGTFEYYGINGSASFLEYLSTPMHNTIRIDGKDQLDKGPRFMWYSSIDSMLLSHSPFEVSGETHAYKNRLPGNPVHRRRVQLLEDQSGLIIEDLVTNAKGKSIDLFWHTTQKSEPEVNGPHFILQDKSHLINFESDNSLKIKSYKHKYSRYYAHQEIGYSFKVSTMASSDHIVIRTYLRRKECAYS